MRQRTNRSVTAFWRRAYEENITGMAAMVAYNLMLSVFPFALLLLFITGKLLQSPDVQATILNQLGLDHEKLTYKHAGRDFRLTDVFGKVIKDAIA